MVEAVEEAEGQGFAICGHPPRDSERKIEILLETVHSCLESFWIDKVLACKSLDCSFRLNGHRSHSTVDQACLFHNCIIIKADAETSVDDGNIIVFTFRLLVCTDEVSFLSSDRNPYCSNDGVFWQ